MFGTSQKKGSNRDNKSNDYPPVNSLPSDSAQMLIWLEISSGIAAELRDLRQQLKSLINDSLKQTETTKALQEQIKGQAKDIQELKKQVACQDEIIKSRYTNAKLEDRSIWRSPPVPSFSIIPSNVKETSSDEVLQFKPSGRVKILNQFSQTPSTLVSSALTNTSPEDKVSTFEPKF
jgi:hypothetical protein